MNLKLMTFSLGLILSSLAFGHGSRGGGETIDINGIPELRDLVEKTNCKWIEGTDMYKSAPALDLVLKKLSTIDWYFAAELKGEIKFLSYCQTSKLARVRTWDPQAIHRSLSVDTSQAGIRLNSDVYVDMEIFEKMSEKTKAFFLIHEAMHSYLYWDTDLRNQKLRSIVKSIEEVYTGVISTRKQFHLQMEKNDIDFPLTVAALTPYRAQVEYLLTSFVEREEILSRISDQATFFGKFEKLNVNLLAPYHRFLSTGVFAKEEKLREACEGLDLASFSHYQKLINNDLISFSICAEVLDLEADDELAPVVLKFYQSGKFMDELTKVLSSKRVSIKEGRLFAEYSLSLLTGKPSVEAQKLILLPVLISSTAMSQELHGFSVFLQYEWSKNGFEGVKKNILSHPRFEAAFKIQETMLEIEALAFAYPKEKEVALKKMPLLYQYFWDSFLETLRDASKAALLKNVLNQKNFGYKI
jgi:hypothetical protein